MMSFQLYCQFCLAPETRPGSDQTPDPGYTCERCERAYDAGRRDEANARARAELRARDLGDALERLAMQIAERKAARESK